VDLAVKPDQTYVVMLIARLDQPRTETVLPFQLRVYAPENVKFEWRELDPLISDLSFKDPKQPVVVTDFKVR